MKTEIAMRVSTARLKAGLSQAEAARKTGVNPVTVWRWETGKSDMTFREAVKLAEIYDVSLDYLAGGE